MNSSLLSITCSVLLLAPSGCGSDDTPPTTPEPVQATFGAISLVLDGAFAPYLHERTAAAPAAVKDFPVDVLCLSQVMREEDKDAIAQAAASEFPYAARQQTTLETDPDDPRTADGTVPPAPATAPCGTAELQAKADDVLACVTAKCSTVPNSEDGYLTVGSCAVERCLAQFSQLLFGDDEHKRCFSCLLYTSMSERISDIRSACDANPRAGFTFQGNNGVMILSRYPLSNVESYVLPSTSWREMMLSASVSAPGASPLDVYCVTLQGPHNAATQPYTGQYSNGATGDAAWVEETKLQARRVVDHVKERSGSRPAVVCGDYYVGPEWTGDGGESLTGVDVEAFDIMTEAFAEAVPVGYVPACTTCGANPINGGTADYPSAWTAHVQTLNMSSESVRTAGTFATEVVTQAVIPDVDPPETMEIPVSGRYGMASTMLLP